MSSALVASTVVSPQPLTNVGVYYGQGVNQTRLSHFCEETSLDIINLAFLNVFPDQGNGYPGSNFGNQCGSATYNISGTVTQLLSDCPQLADDIPVCQSAGKKIFLSLGGAYPVTQEITSDQSGLDFADFIWGAFGPVTDEWTQTEGPRPFGDAVVDGFDFDIEHNGSNGYAKMIHRLQTNYASVPDRQFYLSAAPQCPIPDPQLSVTINKGMFDYIWVQFYNTASCAAINYAENQPGFNYDAWVQAILASSNPNTRLYIGLPASEDSAYTGYYLTSDQVAPLVNQYMTLYPGTFGGIMLWEATSSDSNLINNMTYADNMKAILDQAAEPWTSPPTTGNSSSSNVGWGQINKSSLTWASFNSSSAACPGQSSLDDSSLQSACGALVENGCTNATISSTDGYYSFSFTPNNALSSCNQSAPGNINGCKSAVTNAFNYIVSEIENIFTTLSGSNAGWVDILNKNGDEAGKFSMLAVCPGTTNASITPDAGWGAMNKSSLTTQVQSTQKSCVKNANLTPLNDTSLGYVCGQLVDDCPNSGYISGGLNNSYLLSFGQQSAKSSCVDIAPLTISGCKTGITNVFNFLQSEMMAVNPGLIHASRAEVEVPNKHGKKGFQFALEVACDFSAL